MCKFVILQLLDGLSNEISCVFGVRPCAHWLLVTVGQRGLSTGCCSFEFHDKAEEVTLQTSPKHPHSPSPICVFSLDVVAFQCCIPT